jgi:hypothetical protein
MKKYFLNIAIFLLTVITCDYLISDYLDNVYNKNICSHSGGDLNYFLNNLNADTIVVGSSRVSQMINPKTIGKNIKNVTKVAKHFYYHYSVINLLNQKKRLPKKMLILNLELIDIYESLHERLIDDVFYLKYFYDKSKSVKNIIDSKSNFEKYKFFFKCYKFNGENFLVFKNKFQNICSIDTIGFSPLISNKNDSVRLLKSINTVKKELNNYTKYNYDVFNKIDEISSLCKKKHIKFVLLNGPNIYFPKKYKQASLAMKEFCKKNRITYIDFSLKNLPVFKNKKNWYDQLHLNKEGAEIYSKFLKKEIKKIDN